MALQFDGADARVRTDEIKTIRTATDGPFVTYEGRSLSLNADTSSPIWQIKRTVSVDDETYNEWANDAQYTAVWDDRTTDPTYFPTSVPTGVQNMFSLHFDGINDFTEGLVAAEAAGEYNTSFSAFAWIKISTTGRLQSFFNHSRINSTERGWRMSIGSTQKLIVWIRNTATTNEIHVTSQATPFVANTWYHVGFTYDGSATAAGVTMYIDGAAAAHDVVADTLSATIVDANAALKMGKDFSTFFHGFVDEASWWNSRLTAGQVTEVYNSGVPTDLEALSSVGSLQVWIRCGDDEFDLYPAVRNVRNGNLYILTNQTALDIAADAP